MIVAHKSTCTTFRAPQKDLRYKYGAGYELAPYFLNPLDIFIALKVFLAWFDAIDVFKIANI